MRKITSTFIAIFVVLGVSACMTTPGPGEIGVVRNGGPFDNHNIRQIVPNGAGNTGNGWGSSTHYYPVDSQQRFFKIGGSDADARAITVPTSDGVEVTIYGTFYLNTVFNNTKAGVTAVKAFDTQFSTRTFNGKHAYDGAPGWEAFLGAIVEPIVVNNLRETIAGVQCAELVSSCALVQNSSGVNAQQAAKLVQGKNNAQNVLHVQSSVETGLSSDLISTLRRQYFQNIQFKLNRVVLPPKVQQAIDDAQAAFAQVSQAQARVQTARANGEARVAAARADAKSNALKGRVYRDCPACARIDALKQLPRGLTALGGNFLVGVK